MKIMKATEILTVLFLELPKILNKLQNIRSVNAS